MAEPEVNDEFMMRLREMGVAKVKADLERGGKINTQAKKEAAWTWVYEEEERIRAEATNRTINAAERSAGAAKWAAIASVVAAVAAVITALVSFLK